ncbi:MAG: restriction endonuclease subunit S [Methyloglobulus sp.]|nr:restriction endonuclease subunit S [Methyloglobulus sp.]
MNEVTNSLRLPEGWEIKKLGEVCDVIGGGTPSKANAKFYNGTINWATVRDMQGDKIVETEHKITEVAVKSSSTNIIPKGNIIIATRVGLGKVSLIENDTAINQDLRGIIPKRKSQLSVSYLFQWLKSISHLIVEEGTGATVQGVKLPFIKNLEIPHPPLPEQQRIVAIIDEAFAAIAKAKANAEQNLKNAKELFDSYLQSVFENKGEGWEEVRLSELAIDITDGDHMPPPKTQEGVPFITISNINKQNHRIDFSDTFTVSIEYFQKLKGNRKPKKGDVLYTVTGSYGIPVLIEDDFEFCFQRHIGLIRPKENVSSKWLYYWILSPKAFMQANDTATGTAQKTVSLTALRNFIVPKMSLSDQQTIVQKLDALSVQTKKLEAIYQQHLNDLDELKKSVLQKAFRGELHNPKGTGQLQSPEGAASA